MNKEIEELLNKIRNSIKIHKELNLDDDMLVVLEFDVIQWNLLLSYIEQLEQENQQLKKQKDDVVEYIKESIKHPMYAENIIADCDGGRVENLDKLLRMLGEIE